jgi:uncharacterized protein YegP (UPF0339 family)
MATATKNVRADTSRAQTTRTVSKTASLAFNTYRDNGGNYHWEIVDASGGSLAHSGSFASQDDAERGARKVREGARTASFERPLVNEPHPVTA